MNLNSGTEPPYLPFRTTLLFHKHLKTTTTKHPTEKQKKSNLDFHISSRCAYFLIAFSENDTQYQLPKSETSIRKTEPPLPATTSTFQVLVIGRWTPPGIHLLSRPASRLGHGSLLTFSIQTLQPLPNECLCLQCPWHESNDTQPGTSRNIC